LQKWVCVVSDHRRRTRPFFPFIRRSKTLGGDHDVIDQEARIAVAVFAAPVLSAATASAEGEKYVLVSHAPDSDSWWNTIKNGIALAGEQMGVEVEYRNPPTGDIADMARIIEQAAASGPNGIITTLADYDVLSRADQGCGRSRASTSSS
jgi:hypothetical protein